MAREKDQSGGNRSKGFASMDEERKRQIASQGGLASARGKNTSNRGFASMDKDKQREISRMGGKASRGTHGPHATNDRKADQHDIGDERDSPVSDPDALDKKDKPESSEKIQDDLASSETEENEDEGLGDGNLGRSTRRNVFGK